MSEWNKEFIFHHVPKFKGDFSNLVYPSMLEIQLTSLCNLNCSFCNSVFTRKCYNSLDINVLKSKIKQLSEVGLKAITLEGGGEPSLYENLEDLILFIKSLDIKCGIITNGVKQLNDICCNNLNWIRVSLDSYDEQSYYKIKGQNYFNQVVQNIEYYSTFRPNLTLGISYVVVDNITRNLTNSFLQNVDYLQVKCEENSRIEYSINSQLCKVYNIDCTISDGIKIDSVCNRCYSNQLTSTICPNGDILFCKRLITPIILGNIYQQDILNIYQNNIKKKYVNDVLTDDYNKLCSKPCRMKKYNYAIHKYLDINKNTEFFL
jgi:MoaA/NifB/PqqE/SkfB family radical SAM enzyme